MVWKRPFGWPQDQSLLGGPRDRVLDRVLPRSDAVTETTILPRPPSVLMLPVTVENQYSDMLSAEPARHFDMRFSYIQRHLRRWDSLLDWIGTVNTVTFFRMRNMSGFSSTTWETVRRTPWIPKYSLARANYKILINQYDALWAMNERAQERCRRVTCTCHVGWKLPLEIPQSSTLKLESPYSSQDPKKRWSVRWRTCTDTPITLSKPHIISVSAHVANLSTISSAVPNILKWGVHVLTCIVTLYGHVEAT